MNNDLKKFYKQKFQGSHTVLSDDTKTKVKERIFSNLGAQLPKNDLHLKNSFLEKLRGFFMASYVMVPLLLLLFVGGTTIASANAQPGDKLYGVKRQVEKLQLLTAPDENAHLLLEINFAERRLEEARLAEELRVKNEIMLEQNNPETKATVEVNLDALINDEAPQTQPAASTESRQQKYEAKVKSKLKSDAKHAVEVLTKIKQSYIDKGQNDKAKQIDVLLRKYIRQRDSSNQSNKGKVESIKTETKAKDVPSQTVPILNLDVTPNHD